MKLNRGLVVVAALAVGSAALVGCSKASPEVVDEAQENSVSAAAGTTTDCANAKDETADDESMNEGTTEYARFGHGHGRGHGRGGRGHGRLGFRHGGRGGWGRERGHRAWWRFW